MQNCCIDEYRLTKHLQDSSKTEHLSTGGGEKETSVQEQNTVKMGKTSNISVSGCCNHHLTKSEYITHCQQVCNNMGYPRA